MSWSSLVDPATKKFYPTLVPEGGGIPLVKGQLITADAGGTETAFPQVAPPNGSILSYDATQPLGLAYIAVPGATPLAQGQLISGNAAGASTIVTAPNLPAQANYVLTADGSLGAAGTNMLWKPATGAGGIIDATAPLVDDAGAGTNTISINFTAGVKGELVAGIGTAKTGGLVPPAGPDNYVLVSDAGAATGLSWKALAGSGVITAVAPLQDLEPVAGTNEISIAFTAGPAGQIPYGNGTAKTGALTNTPTAGQVLGVSGGVPAWINPGGSGTITALAPLTEYADGAASKVAIDFTAKGDLVVGAGPQAGGNPVAGSVLPVGANNYVLTANSATGTGLEWRAGAGPIAQTNFYELTFPGSPPFTNVGNVVTLPAPSTIATFTKNELITIMNYETQGAAGGNTFQFAAQEWGNFRGGISGLNTGGNENYYYYAYFQSTQIISLYRTPLPLTANSPLGEYLGGVAQASSGDPTCKVNGFCRTANYIYIYGLFENYIPSGTAPNTTPFSSMGNVIKYNMTTGAFSVLAPAVGLSGLYAQSGEGIPQVYCACACPTTDKASGSYASRPHSIVFGGTFTTAINSTLVCQYVAYYEEGADTFNAIADAGAAGVASPAQTPSADGECLFGASSVLFHPDNNGLIMVFNFTAGVYQPVPAVSQPMTNGVCVYQNVTLPFIYGLGTAGQINNSKNIEYGAGLVRKVSDNTMWLCLGYTDNAPTQNCWWYNLAGAGSGDAFVSPTANPTPPLQVSSGGCDLPQNLLYAYGLLNDPTGTSVVSWFNPPLVAAAYPDGGTYVWEDNQGTADTYIVSRVAAQIELTYTGLNNGAKSWSSKDFAFGAVSLNQSLLPAIVVLTTGPYGEGGRVGTSQEITDQFVGVLAFAGNGLQYIASPTATGFSITKQIVFKTQYSSIQFVVDTAADIYRVVNQYGNIEYT